MRTLRIYILIILLLNSNFLFAQVLCGFDKLHKDLLLKDSNYAKTIKSNEKKIQEYIARHPVNADIQRNNSNAIYTIPVVVHVMHTGGIIGTTYNPSKTQILSAIDYLNKVYNGSYPGTEGAGNIEIQFELAKRTPSSECTDGIERIDASSLPGYVSYGINYKTNLGCPQLTLKNLARWNPDDYYNIWIVNKIDGNDGTSGPSFTAGFAYMPGVLSAYDGIVMLATQMIPGQKTLPHEIGHALNLYHTFENSEDSTDCPSNLFCRFFGDKVCDTDPVSNNVSNDVYSFVCRTWTNPCTETPYNKNTESNYMAYTICYTLFTYGQKERMQAAMSLSSRETLVREDNLALISPIADLIVINQQVSDNNINVGIPFTVYCSESNNGAMHAGSNFVNFHLSPDDLLTPGQNGDIYLDQVEISSGISPLSESLVFNKQISIPATVSPGTYYLFFVADGSGVVNECIEDNNFATVILTITNNTPVTSSGYRVWFDNSYNAGTNYTVSTANDNIIQKLISTSGLAAGIHTLNFQFKKDALSSSVISTLFYKSQITPATGNGKYEYWVDNNYNSRITLSVTNSSNLIILDSLNFNSFSQGLHTLSIRFKPRNSLWSSVTSSFFYKLHDVSSQISAYQYWFDNNWHDTTTILAPNISMLNLQDSLINNLQPGLHTFNIRFKNAGGIWSSITSSHFFKLQEVLLEISAYQYWYDSNWQDTTTILTPTTNTLNLENTLITTLQPGLHTLNIRFKTVGGNWSSITSSHFYNLPSENTGPGKYQYWFDDKLQDSTTITVSNSNNFILSDWLVTNSLMNGLHTLNIRFQIDGRKWSSVNSSLFYKDNDGIITINNLAKHVYWYDNNWQNPKTISIIGTQNINWTLNTDVSELSEGRHNLSMAFKDDRGKWSSIVSDSFTREPITAQACFAGNRLFISGIIAANSSTFQWQMDNGTGFVNISDNATYSGTNSDTLVLINAPTYWYGQKYRCVVTNGSSTLTGPTYTLRFVTTWIGSTDNAWENPTNWSCNSLPDANTDVYINAGMPRYPEVNSNVSCRKLSLQPGTSLQVRPEKNIDITGKE